MAARPDPQAFTHLALINAAISLDRAADHDCGLDELRHRVERRLAREPVP